MIAAVLAVAVLSNMCAKCDNGKQEVSFLVVALYSVGFMFPDNTMFYVYSSFSVLIMALCVYSVSRMYENIRSLCNQINLILLFGASLNILAWCAAYDLLGGFSVIVLNNYYKMLDLIVIAEVAVILGHSDGLRAICIWCVGACNNRLGGGAHKA